MESNQPDEEGKKMKETNLEDGRLEGADAERAVEHAHVDPQGEPVLRRDDSTFWSSAPCPALTPPPPLSAMDQDEEEDGGGDRSSTR